MGKLVPNYTLASMAVSLGGLLNGYDTGAIGAMTVMPQWTSTMGNLSPSLVGFTVSLIMLTGAMPAVFAGNLADRFGRVKTIMGGGILFGLGALIQGSAMSLAQFLVGRALSGLGQGVYLSIVAVYVCEIAPVKSRGILAGLPQFMACAGVCTGYFTCYGSIGIQSSMAWRLPYVIQGIISVFLVGSCFALPDSPRWLIAHGKREEALSALHRLEFSLDEAGRDILTGSEQRTSLSPWKSLVLLFRRGYRARTILALFVLGMVQLSGIDGVLYVRSTFHPPSSLPQISC